jgi:uncharacterized protein (DUF924 family)
VSAAGPAVIDGAGPAEVLDFWFGAPPLQPRAEWFRKSDAFDALVRERFGLRVEQALTGALPAAWHASLPGRLAQTVVLDQFTRNLFRGSARAFAGDAQALALVQTMVANGEHTALHPLQRWFVYLPFEHAEDPALQDESVRLFAALAAEAPAGGEVAAALAAALEGALDYAHRHRDVIQRFGRFPHRNAALGRSSSADEQAWLLLPGSGF